MPVLFWDPSALARRYIGEVGTEAANALFDGVAAPENVTTALSYAEIVSILVRKRNAGALSSATFARARSALRTEVIESEDVGILEIDSASVLNGIPLMERHNINAVDAALLSVFLRLADGAGAGPCAIVTSDQRLVRAARSEGVSALDPEAFDVPGAHAALASLERE